MGSLLALERDLKRVSNKKQAAILQRFFKTGKGEYGEGDIFLGIKVPVQRQFVKKYGDLPLADVKQLLKSKIHEYRLVGILILVAQYAQGDDTAKKKIYTMYLQNTRNVNNWDLVDLSAPNIVGDYLQNKDRSVLYKMAKSKNLWEKRISIISTFAFIRNNDFKDTLSISEILLKDNHDLIHKAVGWMLREVGKRDQAAEERFLNKYHRVMPRTMLRYAIERFREKKRKWYLNSK